MPLHLAWSAIVLRLALTAVACAAIGLDRGSVGRPAGLRTTMLVGLAAAIAMIQVNLLLPVVGKASDSFVVLDLMRLPLGILTGIGFIGAGAIIRRGDSVQGVTTAATLWYVTVMGLCFGGGQIGLGLAALALALFVLWCLKRIEAHIHREHRAELSITFERAVPIDELVLHRIAAAGFIVNQRSLTLTEGGETRQICCDIRWQARPHSPLPLELLRELGDHPGVLDLAWRTIGDP